jgi:hypothetical protein
MNDRDRICQKLGCEPTGVVGHAPIAGTPGLFQVTTSWGRSLRVQLDVAPERPKTVAVAFSEEREVRFDSKPAPVVKSKSKAKAKAKPRAKPRKKG